MRYKVTVIETLTRRLVTGVEAEDEQEARDIVNDPEAELEEEYVPFSQEVLERQIYSIE